MVETLRVGIAGLGTVGAETFRILLERKDMLLSRSGKKIEVVAVSSQVSSRNRQECWRAMTSEEGFASKFAQIITQST